MKGEKGFALVLTLVVTALMVAAAVELIHQVYVDTSLNRGFRDGQQAALLAESGVFGGIVLLQKMLSSQDYTSADQLATPFTMDDEIGRIEITASEESGKINLNALVQPRGTSDTLGILQRLGAQFQIPESQWNALADWIDTDDLTSQGGAESSYYKTLTPPYSARNGKMTTVNELSLVKDFTPDMVAKLRPFVTVYSNEAGSSTQTVNVNTAPKEVLMALDSKITEQVAERIIEERRQTPFKQIGDLGRVDSTLSISLAGRVIFKGKVFRITARGFVKDAVRTIEIVVRENGTILSWQEYGS